MNLVGKLAVTLSAAVMVASACAGATVSNAPASVASQPSAPAPSANAESPSAAVVARKIGVVLPSLSDVSQATLLGFLKTDAEARGWTIDAVDANGAVDQANAAIENLVTKGVDAIITSVFTSDSLQSGIKAATAKGIPVITHGGGAGPGILADFEANGGDVTARNMAQALAGKGSVLAFTYRPGYPCLIREQALDVVMNGYADIKVEKQQVVLPGFAEGAQATTSAWLAAHPAGKGPYAIWGCWDGPSQGAAAAVKQAGRDDVLIYGHNGDAPALVLMKQGLFDDTIWYDYAPTAKAELNTIALILDQGAAWTPASFSMGYVDVTPTTIDAFLAAHPEIKLQ
jgi:ribose transport system substrate-binding protein